MSRPELSRFGWRSRRRDAPAITTLHRALSVGEVKDAADVLALHLAEALPEGGCLLLPSADPADFLVGLMACHQAGVAVTPWRETTQDLTAIVDIVRPDGILRVGAPSWIQPVQPLRSSEPHVGDLIMMTSGSTGAPKGVSLHLEQVIRNAAAAGTLMEVSRCEGWAIDIDMALMSALSHLLMAWHFDVPLHHLGGRDESAVSSVFQNSRCGFGGSPIQLLRLKERLLDDAGPHMMVSSGDFLSPGMIDEILTSFPATTLHKLYGLTELSGRFCCLPHDKLVRSKASVGWPIPGLEARVTAPDGEIGEVEARGDFLMEGYYRAGGVFERRSVDWFSTGDLGFLQPDGSLTLVGRGDDVVKVGGEKVDRQSIEQALSDLFGDREYVVLGVAHPLVGQCPALFVAAARDDSALPRWADIVAHIRHQLPSRFVPALMYRLDGPLPRLPNGKIDRETLKSNHRNFGRLK